MKSIVMAMALGFAAAPASVSAQDTTAAQLHFMPASTSMTVTPQSEISSKHVKVGDKFTFATVGDVLEQGHVVIPRGSPVTGTITWKTGRAVGGKSGKFDVTFNSVDVGGHTYAVRGVYRQEGRGNTVGALLGSIIISGRSAVMMPGQEVSIFTAEQIPY